MITVRPKVNDEELKKLITRLSRLKVGPRALVQDLRKLGENCYKDFKQIIPISKYPKPHLRNSFKIKVRKEEGTYGPRLILSIETDKIKFPYARYVDRGASIPVRYPSSKRSMKFIGKTGDVIFAKKVKGFKISRTNFIRRGETFLKRNIWHYVDRTLKRYI